MASPKTHPGPQNGNLEQRQFAQCAKRKCGFTARSHPSERRNLLSGEVSEVATFARHVSEFL
jgi:hypothetical protein